MLGGVESYPEMVGLDPFPEVESGDCAGSEPPFPPEPPPAPSAAEDGLAGSVEPWPLDVWVGDAVVADESEFDGPDTLWPGPVALPDRSVAPHWLFNAASTIVIYTAPSRTAAIAGTTADAMPARRANLPERSAPPCFALFPILMADSVSRL